MRMSDSSASLLNVFNVEHNGETIHLLCFVDPAIATAEGLSEEWIVGELDPDETGELRPEGLRVNPEFVLALSGYLNHLPSTRPQIVEQGRAARGDERLVLLDPRFQGGPADEPPFEDVLGSYKLESDGEIVSGSFVYNSAHRLFDPVRGPSGLFFDLLFHEWLHPNSID
jgi:hypothetical protein